MFRLTWNCVHWRRRPGEAEDGDGSPPRFDGVGDAQTDVMTGLATPNHAANPVVRWRVSCSCWTEPVSRIKLLSAQKAQEEGQMFPRGGGGEGGGGYMSPSGGSGLASALRRKHGRKFIPTTTKHQTAVKLLQSTQLNIFWAVISDCISLKAKLWWLQPSSGEADASVRLPGCCFFLTGHDTNCHSF